MPSDEGSEQAIATALHKAAEQLETYGFTGGNPGSGGIMDANGNTVGRWDYTEGDVEPDETPILAPGS
jgi:hypothetical protein